MKEWALSNLWWRPRVAWFKFFYSVASLSMSGIDNLKRRVRG